VVPASPGGTGGGKLESTTTGVGGVIIATTGGSTTGGAATTGGTTGAATTGGTTGGTTGARTPVVVRTLTVDTFSDLNTFNMTLNSMTPPQVQHDGGSMATYAVVGGALQLACPPAPAPPAAVPPCYWYTLLASAQNAQCLDATPYTHIALSVRGGPTAGVSLELQYNNAACTAFLGSQWVNLRNLTPAVPFDDAWHEVLIPLTLFPTVDKVHVRAIAISGLVPTVPIFLDNLRLVTIQ
jgi:hypothetical protein